MSVSQKKILASKSADRASPVPRPYPTYRLPHPLLAARCIIPGFYVGERGEGEGGGGGVAERLLGLEHVPVLLSILATLGVTSEA